MPDIDRPPATRASTSFRTTTHPSQDDSSHGGFRFCTRHIRSAGQATQHHGRRQLSRFRKDGVAPRCLPPLLGYYGRLQARTHRHPECHWTHLESLSRLPGSRPGLQCIPPCRLPHRVHDRRAWCQPHDHHDT